MSFSSSNVKRAKFGNVMAVPPSFGFENVVWKDNQPHGISRIWPDTEHGTIFTRTERTSMNEVIYPAMSNPHQSIDDHVQISGIENQHVDERHVDPSLFNIHPNYLGKRNYESSHDDLYASKVSGWM